MVGLLKPFTGDTELIPQLPKPRNGVLGKSTNSGGESCARVVLCEPCCVCWWWWRSSAFGTAGGACVKYLDISASVSATLVDLRLFFVLCGSLVEALITSSGFPLREFRNVVSEKARSGTGQHQTA